MKDTTEIVCQHNFSETAQRNFLKLCSNEGHPLLQPTVPATLTLYHAHTIY